MISDDEFIKAWEDCDQSPAKVARFLGMGQRSVYSRRRSIEGRGKLLETHKPVWEQVFENVRQVSVDTGHVIVFSDGHFWPGIFETPAYQALLAVIKRLKPRIIVANGDMVDGASTNRHDPSGWSTRPNVQQEIEATSEVLQAIQLAAPKDAAFFWNIGNHDLNFERRICTALPQYADMPMMRLADHFPDWTMQWSIKINGDVIVKHRYHNGIHAGYNNTMKSGRTIVTGHLHRLLVTPWADYNGRRWGVDTGTIAPINGPQFEYMENNPRPWCGGFAVLTFRDGKLLPPELVEVIDGKACWRGDYI